MPLRQQLLSRTIDIPMYKGFRTFGRPVLPPLHLTLALTYKCKNRCLTCRSWENSPEKELSAAEWQLFFKSLGYKPLAVTLTGGSPLARPDFLKIADMLCEIVSPPLVFIETGGDMPVRMQKALKALTEKHPRTRFAVMFSLPGYSGRLDELRGVEKGSFENFLRSYKAARATAARRLSVGVNVPVSIHNVSEARAVIDQAFLLYPDLVSFSPVHGSEELRVSALEISPDAKKLGAALDYYLTKTRKPPGRGFNRLMQPALRRQASIACANLRYQKQTVPCQAGYASVYISPDGSVKDCPVAAREMGDLRENQFDFMRILNTHTARRVRKEVATSGCFCPMDYSAFSHLALSFSMYAGLLLPL